MRRSRTSQRSIKRTEICFTVKSVCETLDFEPRTISLYVRRGLIQTRRIESSGGKQQALFSSTDLQRLRRIRLLTAEMGVNLAGVEIILRLLDQLENR